MDERGGEDIEMSENGEGEGDGVRVCESGGFLLWVRHFVKVWRSRVG